jgi:hypothetical protein
MFCPICRRTIPDKSIACPGCGHTFGGPAPEDANLSPEERKAQRQRMDRMAVRSIWWTVLGTLVTTVALTVAVLVTLACPRGASFLTGRSPDSVPQVAAVEAVLNRVHDRWTATRRSFAVNATVFTAVVVVAALAWMRTSTATLRWAPSGLDSAASLILTVASTIVVALFAVRLRHVLFATMSQQIDWMMNSFACATGVIVTLLAHWRRR